LNEWGSTWQDCDPALVESALNSLADSFRENEFWLHRKAENYVTRHRDLPEQWAAPALLDWIWVDLQATGPRNRGAECKLWIPPFSGSEDRLES
jgi:hypothetical protein